MQCAIRVDASSAIGTGHLMRCLTLANALAERGADIVFVSRHMPPVFRDLLHAQGHRLEMLPSARDKADSSPAHAQWLGTSQAADADGTLRVLSRMEYDWLVVDHYALDARWEATVRRCASRVFVIDDLADRQHDCDLLLDQNLYPDMDTRYRGRVPGECRALLGPAYALLRYEFRDLRQRVAARRGALERLLVFFGGVDGDNLTMLAVEALRASGIRNVHVDVVIGAQHPRHLEVRAACDANGFTCHVQTSRMADLLASADLALGGGGASTWERCALGVPSIVIALVHHQVDISEAVATAGAQIYLGEAGQVSAEALARAVSTAVTQPERLAAISRAAMRLVDAAGCERVLDVMDSCL